MVKKKDSSITQVVKQDEQNPQDRLSILKSRLEIAKEWCKKPHAAWKKWIAEYEIDDISDTQEIRDKVRIGYVFRRVESDLPAIFDDQPELFIKGKGKNRILDPLIEGTYDWLWDTQNLEEVVEDAATYFILLGMGGVESPYVTKNKVVNDTEQQPVLNPTTGQPVVDPATGQPASQEVPVQYEVAVVDNPQAEASNLFKIFFSPETKFGPILDYAHCPYYFREHVMTKEEIKAKFNKDITPSETLHVDGNEDINLKLSEMKDETMKDDIKRAKVYEYYGCLPEALAKGIKTKDGQPATWTYDKDYHLFFTNNEELLAEECQYECKPLFLMGNYGLANKFFKFGEAKHLMPLVQELQAYRTQVLRHTRKSANPKVLVTEEMEVDEKALTDPREGVVVKYKPGNSLAKPEYMQVGQLGAEVFKGVDMARTDLEKTSGSFDLASGGGQSQVKSPRGIQVFSEAADKSSRRKRKKVARLIRQLIIFQFKQLAENWEPDGTHSIDVIAEGEEQKIPVVEEVLQVLGDPNILAKLDIEIESMSINRVQMKQDSLDLLDNAIKSEQAFPGILNLQEIWKDVLQNAFNKKDADRYMVSMQQMAQQNVMQFVQQMAQANPQLAAQVAQFMQQPNMQGLQQDSQVPPQNNQPTAMGNNQPLQQPQGDIQQ